MTNSRLSNHIPGVGRVMITDGGPHPTDFWAQVTAEHIAPIGPDVKGKRRQAALLLQMKIADALEPHHAAVQDKEREHLKADAATHLASPLNPEPHLDGAIAAIVEAAKGTEWEEHFANAEVQATIRFEVGRHFATSQDIERRWHLDRSAA